MYEQLKADLLHLALGGEDRWANAPVLDHPMSMSMDIISAAYGGPIVPVKFLSARVGRRVAALNRLEWLVENYPEGVDDV